MDPEQEVVATDPEPTSIAELASTATQLASTATELVSMPPDSAHTVTCPNDTSSVTIMSR